MKYYTLSDLKRLDACCDPASKGWVLKEKFTLMDIIRYEHVPFPERVYGVCLLLGKSWSRVFSAKVAQQMSEELTGKNPRLAFKLKICADYAEKYARGQNDGQKLFEYYTIANEIKHKHKKNHHVLGVAITVTTACSESMRLILTGETKDLVLKTLREVVQESGL